MSHPSRPQPTTAMWLVVLARAAVIVVASITDASWPVRRGALFLHLGAPIAGFGAVLVVDLHGVLWLVGRRRLGDLLQITSALQAAIWGHLAVLVASGLLLGPNLLLPGPRSSSCWCSSPP